jgi:hypothetical protein
MLWVLMWDQMGSLGESGGLLVGKGGDSDVESQDL